MDITIHTTCFKKQFRGILLYAVDEEENRVGDWYVPFDAPQWFSHPWKEIPGHTCQNSLMHASAGLKPYLNIVKFLAPPAGTGTITFRCLIKEGVANTGAFYWPNNGTDLTLPEGPASAAKEVTWTLAQDSRSCDDVCGDSALSCDETSLQGLNSQTLSEVLVNHPCKLPLLSGCGADGASFDPVNEFCYYVDTGCAADNRTASSVTCSSVAPSGMQRFCPCGDMVSATSYSRPSTGLLSVALVSFFLMFGNYKMMIGILLIYSSMVTGHNWLQSNARAQGASTIAPCPPKQSPMPHAQVGPNQPFQIEWMNGHGGPNYFMILHADDADKMILNKVNVLEEYIRDAPAGSNTAQQPQFQRYFRNTANSTTHIVVSTTGPNITTTFQRLVPPGDQYYYPRPTEFVNPIGNNNLFQLAYRPQDIATDVRVSYLNPKYPWLEAVYKFNILTMNPGRPDFTNFIIPGRKGPGRYIVQWYWRGYYDCVDVDLKPTVVQEVYGHAPNGSVWTRIDHCLFDEPVFIFGQSEVITDPAFCLDNCVNNPNCYGVNVVPLMAPAGVYDFKVPNSRFPQIRGADIYVPWYKGEFNNTRNLFMSAASPDRYMCYAVRPKQITDVTQQEYLVSDDPTDPVFHSTCYLKFTGRSFSDYEDENYKPPDVDVGWRYQHQCISCKQKAVNDFSNNGLPDWNVAPKCVNCYREPARGITEARPPHIMVANNSICDGHNGGWSQVSHRCQNMTCTMRLTGILNRATGFYSLDECRLLASRNSSCSNVYYHQRNANPARGDCWCYLKDPCCRTCSRRASANWFVYEMESTPDPTCATGRLSDDGKYCCSGTCGVGLCGVETATTTASVGFCATNYIVRSCAQYGPPCMMPVTI